MGIVFVILMHLVFLFIISLLVAFFSGIITAFISTKEKKKRKILLAVFIPFHLFFSFYFLGLLGSIIVSETKKVDLGIGDSWYAPIDDSYRILMIDLPEQAYIERNGETIISQVSEMQKINNKVFCKTYDGHYYSINLTTKKTKEYQNLNELTKGEGLTKLNLVKTVDFYETLKWKVSGTATILVGILSIIVSILSAILIYRFIIYGMKLGMKKIKNYSPIHTLHSHKH